eukprot:TRINITY_DN5116_c0_g1_i1.p1 TRINITY_DN5116_c0_g1~~TRINITY_DN5116_c0_g1_i1.p1  ORF type:complete len:386 (-),score=90.00 TRINITY_DN5116_c0_g1_i1:62-1219(-)
MESSSLGKRRRGQSVQSACQQCKTRKQKCSEERPCSNCTKRGVPQLCTDSPPPTTTQQSSTGNKNNNAENNEDELPKATRRRLSFGKKIFPRNQFLLRYASEASDGGGHKIQRPLSSFCASFPDRSYFTSLWVKHLPKQDMDLVVNYHWKYPLGFIAEFLLKRPLSWKWFVSTLQGFIGPIGSDVIHHQVLRSILEKQQDELDEFDKKILTVMKEEKISFGTQQHTFITKEKISMSPEEEEIVKSLFNVQCLENSDIGIYRSIERFNLETRTFEITTEANAAASLLLGMPLEQFVALVQAGRGLFSVPFSHWPYDPDFWPLISDFILGSVFKSPSWMTEVVMFRDVKGQKIPCLMHAFASYDESLGVRTALTHCVKPLSKTFKPN